MAQFANNDIVELNPKDAISDLNLIKSQPISDSSKFQDSHVFTDTNESNETRNANYGVDRYRELSSNIEVLACI